MTREESSHHRLVVNMYANVDGSVVDGGTATTNGLDTAAKQHMTVTENSSGNYTFTLNNPGQRFVGLVAQAITALTTCVVAITSDGLSATVIQTTASTGAVIADADFFLMMAVSHAEDPT